MKVFFFFFFSSDPREADLKGLDVGGPAGTIISIRNGDGQSWRAKEKGRSIGLGVEVAGVVGINCIIKAG